MCVCLQCKRFETDRLGDRDVLRAALGTPDGCRCVLQLFVAVVVTECVKGAAVGTVERALHTALGHE